MDFVFSTYIFVFIELIKMAKAEPKRILHCHIFRNLKDVPALITSNGTQYTGFTIHVICHVIFIYHNQYQVMIIKSTILGLFWWFFFTGVVYIRTK